ncbi:MAG TPA: PLP-dependent aminotransferase family protein [Rhizobiaceae bacterium]|nr:PLP-dependent aminotransferase family protein [Rhizobiaceae bacterium]
MNIRLADRMSRVKPSAIRELLRLGADPSIISFGGGYPDASLFPFEQLESVYRASIAGVGREALQYTVSNGIPKLREQIAARMTRDGIACTAENVLVLQGAQQGLDLVAKMLVDKGDVIVTENPTFLGALIAFNPCEPRYAVAQIDDNGMDMDDLEQTLERNPGAKLVYTVPDFQNPTGVTMSLDRRKKLVELANRFDLVILEDSPYREIRYEGEPIPSIKSFDTEGRVIYLGSFSKILAPGLRLGWAVASEELIQQLGLLKLAADTQSSTLNMTAVSLFLDTYDIDAHIASIRRAYRHKKDVMLETIRRTFPQDVAFTEPSGGLFTWLTFPEDFDTARFMAEHALPQAKVGYVPGATFFPLEQEVNHARLSYSTQPDDVIVKGISALGKLLTARRA